MSRNAKIGIAVVAVLALAGGAYALVGGKDQIIDALPGGDPATCPLSGVEPRGDGALDRPAVAVKVENAPVAYPLSGLEDAEIVYEELVEGGVTRFMALYGCTDSKKVGPVRSARAIDPAIMTPATRILGFSGANNTVLEALDEAGIVQVEESQAGAAMQRIPREGLASEHTLYADTAKLRRVGAKRFDDPPPDDLYEFGDLEGDAKRARSVTIEFSDVTTVRYDFRNGKWLRFQAGEPFVDDAGEQIAVDNVLVEEHVVNESNIVDVTGTPSVEIADVTGSGRAVLFRDGRVVTGRWVREEVEGAVRFETRGGDAMVFAPGTTWIHLVPNDEGDVKGSFSFER